MTRSRKMTLVKGIKLVIALAPAASDAVSKYQMGGGGTAGAQLALSSLGESYTGYSIYENKFTTASLARGYVPLIGAWAFGKIASRVLR